MEKKSWQRRELGERNMGLMELGAEGEHRRRSLRHPFPHPAGLVFLRTLSRLSSQSSEPRTSRSHVTRALPSGLRFEVHVCPVVRRPISASPGLNLNPVSFSFVPKHFPYSFQSMQSSNCRQKEWNWIGVLYFHIRIQIAHQLLLIFASIYLIYLWWEIIHPLLYSFH